MLRTRLERETLFAAGAEVGAPKIMTGSVGVAKGPAELTEIEEEAVEHNEQRAPWAGTTGRGMHRGPGQKYRGSSAAGA